MIVTTYPIYAIIRNSIARYQNNDILNHGTRTATIYVRDLNIVFTNLLNRQKFDLLA